MSHAPGSALEAIQVGGRLRPLPDAAVRRVVAAVLRGERRHADISVTFLGRDAMRQAVADSVPSAAVELNMTAFDRGYDYGLEQVKPQ